MHRSFERTGHAAGVILFLVGTGLLVLCFLIAYTMFKQPVPGLSEAIRAASAPPPPNQPGPSGLPAIGGVLIAFMLKLIMLAVMIVVASHIASRGIHQYFAAAGPVTTVSTASGGANPASQVLPTEPPRPPTENGASGATPGESPSSLRSKANSPQ